MKIILEKTKDDEWIATVESEYLDGTSFSQTFNDGFTTAEGALSSALEYLI
jgi:hypothetical protein